MAQESDETTLESGGGFPRVCRRITKFTNCLVEESSESEIVQNEVNHLDDRLTASATEETTTKHALHLLNVLRPKPRNVVAATMQKLGKCVFLWPTRMGHV